VNQLLDRVSIDPKVCFGKPCIKGTRIWVSLIRDFLANWDSEQEILAAYPHRTHEDILAAIAYGAEEAARAPNPSGRDYGCVTRPIPLGLGSDQRLTRGTL
jgi:uncharacterized protein (DUF433 family)